MANILNGQRFPTVSRPPLLELDQDIEIIDEDGHNLDSEITVQFEDEIQTLYVGPVAIKDKEMFHENSRKIENNPLETPSGPIQVVLVQTLPPPPPSAATTTPIQLSSATQYTAAGVQQQQQPRTRTACEPSPATKTILIDPNDSSTSSSKNAKGATKLEKSPIKAVVKGQQEASQLSKGQSEVEKGDKVLDGDVQSEQNYENPSPGSDSGIENGLDEVLEPQTAKNCQQGVSIIQSTPANLGNNVEVGLVKVKFYFFSQLY